MKTNLVIDRNRNAYLYLLGEVVATFLGLAGAFWFMWSL